MNSLFTILIFFAITSLVAGFLISLSLFLAPKNPYADKNTAYECGYDPIEDSHKPYTIKFSLVAILFLIFDLETIFLLPMAYIYKAASVEAVIAFAVFIFILTIGFIYEWITGALDWR